MTQIFAHSPEAKVRVELFNGTFQDRLVSELRPARAATIAEANAVLATSLPRFNARFDVPSVQPGSSYRSLGADLDPASTLCISTASPKITRCSISNMPRRSFPRWTISVTRELL